MTQDDLPSMHQICCVDRNEDWNGDDEGSALLHQSHAGAPSPKVRTDHFLLDQFYDQFHIIYRQIQTVNRREGIDKC